MAELDKHTWPEEARERLDEIKRHLLHSDFEAAGEMAGETAGDTHYPRFEV